MLTQCNVPDNIIRSLDNKPIDGGLTPDQLKDKFDEGYEGIKTYLNGTLIPELHRPASIINGNFRYPVNQYGRTSGAAFSTTDAYFLDMWKLISGSVTWTAGTGFSLNGELRQFFEAVPTDLYDETIPVTINAGGNDYVKLLTFPDDTSETDTETAGGVTITVGYEAKNTNLCGVAVTHVPYITLETASAVTIEYVYSVTPPANYPEQLAKCQRYCCAVQYNVSRMTSYTSGTMAFRIPLPTQMRTTPSIASGTLIVRSTSGTDQTGFTFAVTEANASGVQVVATKTSHGLTDAVLRAETLTILSADL